MKAGKKQSRNRLLLALIPLLALSLFLLSCNVNSYPDAPHAVYKSAIIYGDSRTGYDKHRQIIKLMLKDKPEVIFNTGDIVENGYKKNLWKKFNEIVSPLLKVAEYYPALGNHERNSQLYFDNFILPNNERWYSVDWNNIHFIVLDSNSNLKRNSRQFIWLRNDLDNVSKNIKFIIVIEHHPLFTMGLHEEDEKGFKKDILPVLEKSGVDMVFSGHDHNYQRFLYNGIYYIVTGGGGSPLHSKKRDSSYNQIFNKDYHYCRLSAIDNKLHVEVIDIDSKLIDSFTLYSERSVHDGNK